MSNAKRIRVHCDQCAMLMINGVACHEVGCPNMNARWDRVREEWVRQRKCFECGCMVDEDDACCDSPFECDGCGERTDNCTCQEGK